MRRLIANFVSLAGLAAIAVDPIAAQDVSCRTCRIAVTQIASLSSAGTAAVPSLMTSVAEVRSGYVVSYLFQAAHIALFDRSGEVIAEYDRSGRGPGEMQRFADVFAVHPDTLLVVDGVRFMWLDAQLNHVETRDFRELGQTRHLISLPDRTLIARFAGQGNDRTMYSETVAIDRYGNRVSQVEPRSSTNWSSLLGNAHDGGFYLIRSNESSIDRYDAAGRLRDRTQLRGSRFVEWAAEDIDVRDAGQPPLDRQYRAGIVEIAHDTVLVWTRMPDIAKRQPIDPSQMIRPSTMDQSEEFDTLLEIFDARTGSLLASTMHPELLRSVSGSSDLLHSTVEVEDGHVVVRMWRVELASR